MKAYGYLYSMDDNVDPLDYSDSFELRSNWERNNVKYVAEDAAEDYYRNHDGWECSWPQVVHIWQEDGTFIGSCTVEMEAVPSFSASSVQ
jgi:hypothetical protein